MRSISILLSLSLAAVLPSAAHAASRSFSPFLTLGASSDAPQGYIDLCQRQPGLCAYLEGRSESDVIASVAQTTLRVADASSASATGSTATPQQDARSLAATPAVLRATDLARQSLLGRARAMRATVRPTMALAPIADTPWTTPTNPIAGTASFTRKFLVVFNNRVNRSILQLPDINIYGVGERWSLPVGQGKPMGDCEDIALEKRLRLVNMGMDPHDLAIAVVYSRRFGLHSVLVAHLPEGDFVLDSLSARVRRWSEVDYVWLRVQDRRNPAEWRSVVTAPAPRMVQRYFGREEIEG